MASSPPPILVSRAATQSEDEHDIIDEVCHAVDATPGNRWNKTLHPDAIKAYLIHHYWESMGDSAQARYSDFLFNRNPTFAELAWLHQGLLDIGAPGNAALIARAIQMVEPFRAFDEGTLSVSQIADRHPELYDELFDDDAPNHASLMQMGLAYDDLLAYEDLIGLLSAWLKQHPQLKLTD